MTNKINGLRVLVVEDDALIAMALEMTLSDLGCEVVGIVSNVKEAEPLARDLEIDGAILDINLDGETVYPIADILSERKIPFVFATGYGSAGLREVDKQTPVLQKPYRHTSLAQIVNRWPTRQEVMAGEKAG